MTSWFGYAWGRYFCLIIGVFGREENESEAMGVVGVGLAGRSLDQ